ncbi:MAG: head GIN domain-containing protein [Cyclobacteriaceae bacterium]
MSRYIFLSLMVFLPALGFSQESVTRSVEPFRSIRVNGPVDVRLVKGSKTSVRIETVGIPSGDVKTNVSGSSLRIDLENYVLKNRSNIDVWVTYSELDRIICTGACNVFSAEPLQIKSLDLEATTASTIEVEVQSERIFILASTAGQVIVSGRTENLDVECATSASVEADRLSADHVKVEARTAATAKVQALETIDADIATAASLRYKGNPTKTNLQSSTGGSIRKPD